TQASAVGLLRRRKRRRRKPLAVMVRDLAAARRICTVSEAQARLLTGPVAPIVLLPRRPGALPDDLAPGNPGLGVMLAYAPLHHLLLAALGRPVVATSGNLSDEPICTENAQALERLAGLADGFLIHDRPIERPVEDSVMQIAADQPMVLRAGRGLAPVTLPRDEAGPAGLAVGAYLKSAPAVATRRQWVLAAHVGDLDTPQARDALEASVADHLRLYHIQPGWVARDLHPDYPSSDIAERWPSAVIRPVQHHHAHIAAVMAEHALTGPVLGVAWDGVGLGDDGTAWGGECLVAERSAFHRFARLRPFPLPGGD
ncbi:carbamoyltransferase HypF, partial [Ectothiorhodospiraceae bacterium WFHF3C12]|nr:carbamoyltransferase HypF [Ectothiorhodospiraceae bacterium WFHF3C12]